MFVHEFESLVTQNSVDEESRIVLGNKPAIRVTLFYDFSPISDYGMVVCKQINDLFTVSSVTLIDTYVLDDETIKY